MNALLRSLKKIILGLLIVSSVSTVHAQRGDDGKPSRSSSSAIRDFRAAVALQNRQVYDLATAEWRAFIQRHGGDPLAGKAHHYLGVCLFQQGDFAAAEKAFESAVGSLNDKALMRDSLLNMGLAQFNLGRAADGRQRDDSRLERAVKTLGLVTREFANTSEAAEASFFIGEAQYALGNKQSAISAYRTAAASGDTDRRAAARFGLGVALQDLGKHAEAEQQFERVLSEAGDSRWADEARMRRADALFAAEKFDAAEREFKKLVKQRGFEFQDYAAMRLAACQFGKRNYADAAASYVQITSRFSDSEYAEQATLAAGKSYHFAGNQAAAGTWLARAARMSPAVAAEATHWLARTMLDSGQAIEAIRLIDRAVGEADGDLLVDLKLDKADALYEIPDRRKEASALYAEISKQHPEHESAPHAWYMSAFAALEAGQTERAGALAKEFLKRLRDHELTPDVLAVLGESQLAAGDAKQAEETYRRLIQDYADTGSRRDLDVWRVRHGLCLNLQGKHTEVVRTLERRLDRMEDASLLSEAAFLVGAAHYHQENVLAAARRLEQAWKADPQSSQGDRTLLLWAKALREDGKSERALQLINRLVGKFPNSEILDRALLEQAELWAQQGEHQKSSSAYQKLMDSFSDSQVAVDAIYGWGWSLLQAGEYQGAFKVFDKLINLGNEHPRAADAHYGRAVAAQQLGRNEAALKDVQTYLDSNPSDAAAKADAYYLRGLCQSSKKDFSRAAASFEKALRVDPTYKDTDKVLYELAWALESDGQQKKSAAVFRELAKQFPRSELAAESQYRAGEVDFENENYRRAARQFESVANGKANRELQQHATYKLGWCHYHSDDFSEAEQAFEKLAASSAKGSIASESLLMLGECRFQRKAYPSALAAYRRAMGGLDDSENPQLNALAMLHAGQAAAATEDWSSSIDFLSQVVRKYPDSENIPEAKYELAWALQNSGQKDKAEKLYADVVASTDSVVAARAQFMQGELQFLRKDFDGAIRTFFKVAYGYGHPRSPRRYHEWQANAMFEAARCCESTKRLDSARKLYSDLIKFHPDHDKAQDAKRKLESIAKR